MLELFFALQLVTGSCREVVLEPRTTTGEFCEETEHGASYFACELGDEKLSAEINRLISRRVREESKYDEASVPPKCDSDEKLHLYEIHASCEKPYVRGNVISVACNAGWSGGAHPDGIPFAVNLLVQNDTVLPLELESLYADARASDALLNMVRADLDRQIKACRRDGDSETAAELRERIAENAPKIDAFHFSEAGLVVSYSHYTFGYCVMDSTVPYEKLTGIVRDFR